MKAGYETWIFSREQMSKIKQLLQLKKAGASNRQIARDLKMIMVKVIAIAKTITTFQIRLPNRSVYTETLCTTLWQKAIKPFIDALSHTIR